MDVLRFQNSPLGQLVPIDGIDGRTKRPFKHFAYQPDPLGTYPLLSQETWSAVSRASHALGKLTQAALQVPEPSLLRRPTLRREAQSTSALEGTYAPMEQVLAVEDEDQDSFSPEMMEVWNYITAAEAGFSAVTDGASLSVGTLLSLHRLLVLGTDADTAEAGRVRSNQVVIGSTDESVEQSRFVPPPPGMGLEASLQDLIRWARDRTHEDDPIVAAAMAHYQFETLHPFNDGNGRIGRLLVVMQMMTGPRALITQPLLSISPWFEARRTQYMELLAEVSATGAWNAWIKFFASGIADSADDTAGRVADLLALQGRWDQMLKTDGAKGVITEVVAHLIANPFISPAREAARTRKTTQAIYNVVDRLLTLGILTPSNPSQRYGRTYVARDVVDIIMAPSR